MISDYLQAAFWIGSGKSSWIEIIWFLIFSIVLFLAGVLLLLYLKFFLKENLTKRKYLGSFSWGLVLLGIVGIIFGLFREEGVSFFSAYAFWALQLIATIFWIVLFSFRFLKLLPKEQASYESFMLKQRYLPRRKKK